MSAHLQNQESPASLPAVPILTDIPVPPRKPGTPIGTGFYLTSGDKWWARWFFILALLFLAVSFAGQFSGFAFLIWVLCVASLVGFILVLAIMTLAGLLLERRPGGALRGFLGRLTLLGAGILTLCAAWPVSRGLVMLGWEYSAKWGLDLDAIRNLQTSSAVAALSRSGGNLASIPADLESKFWDSPNSVEVLPNPSGPPAIKVNWGGGFGYWGIVITPGGYCPLAEKDFYFAQWEGDVWMFRSKTH